MFLKIPFGGMDKKFKVVCWGLLEQNKKIVFIQEGTRAFHGRWGLPMATLKMNEDIISAVKRGVQEDINLDVQVDALLGIYHWFCKELDYGFLYIIFILSNPLGEIKPKHPEVLNTALWDYQQIFQMPPESFTHRELIKIIKRYRRGERYPLEIIQAL